MSRTERWLRNSNDPLVIALSDYEATLDQLTAAQELRVESASEVLAGMKLIAGRAGHARPLHPLPFPIRKFVNSIHLNFKFRLV